MVATSGEEKGLLGTGAERSRRLGIGMAVWVLVFGEFYPFALQKLRKFARNFSANVVPGLGSLDAA